jgi:RHS repeat-associated protein
LREVVREGNVVARYDYDVFNRRVKKVVAPAPVTVMPTVTYYLYSDEGLLAEYDESGTEIRSYGWKPQSTWGTDPVWQRSSHSPFSILHYSFFLTDHLGTPQKLITATGQTAWNATYDTFGRATVAASSTVENNLRFPGQYFDAETGFHYNWHRYYLPELGRYNRLDPIKDDRNWYGYAGGNSITGFDYRGLKTFKVGECEILIVIMHGNESSPNVDADPCSRMGFIGCFPEALNKNVPRGQLLPSVPLHNDKMKSRSNGDAFNNEWINGANIASKGGPKYDHHNTRRFDKTKDARADARDPNDEHDYDKSYMNVLSDVSGAKSFLCDHCGCPFVTLTVINMSGKEGKNSKTLPLNRTTKFLFGCP